MIAGARKVATAVVAVGALLVLWLGACGSPPVTTAPSGPLASTSADPAQPDPAPSPRPSPRPSAVTGDAGQQDPSAQSSHSAESGAPTRGSAGAAAAGSPSPGATP